MNFFSNKTLQKTISVLMLLVVCLMMVPQGVDAETPPQRGAGELQVNPGGRIPNSSNPDGRASQQQVTPNERGVSEGGRAEAAVGVTPSLASGTGPGVPSKDFCNFGFFEKGTYASQVTTCMSYIMLSTSGYFLYFSGIAFNFILDYTLNMPKFIEQFNIIDVGWGAFRDISLVFFVFIILFIAINMIVGKEAFGSKKLLSQVIVAAILINFSLFFTKAMVDASNILALQFYTKIVQNSTDSLVAGGNQQYLNDADSGISAAFAHAMGLDQIWSAGTQGNAVDIEASAQNDLDWLNILTAGVFGSVFIMVTAVVFLAGAIMMLVRTLVLIFLMIMSPFAWIGGILPMTKEISSKWWSALSSNLMYAPVYMMLMYVVMSMIIGRGNRTVDFLGMFTGSGVDSVAVTAFTFVVLNALMIGCILVANKAGAAGAGMASKVAGGAVLGTAAWASRQTVGRAANAWASSEKAWGGKNSTGYVGRNVFSALSKTSKASMDLRGISSLKKGLGSQGINLGDEKTGGIKQAIEDKAKSKTEFGNTMGQVGRSKYARSLSSRWGRSNSKASDDLMKTAISEEVTKYTERIKEIEEGPMKRIKYLNDKQKQIKSRDSTKDLDKAELAELETLEEIEEVKYDRFDDANGTWSKDAGNQKGYVRAIDDMRKERTKAQAYIRSKGWKKKTTQNRN